jgi:hypothetical protein
MLMVMDAGFALGGNANAFAHALVLEKTNIWLVNRVSATDSVERRFNSLRKSWPCR